MIGAGIGAIAGVYPAVQAANKDVIEALAPLDERSMSLAKGQLPLFEPDEPMALPPNEDQRAQILSLLDDLRLLQAAYEHQGSALIEIYQNCNVFNDKAFIALTGKGGREHNRINLEAGKPIIFGADDDKAVVFRDGQCRIVDRAAVDPSEILVHDPQRQDPTIAFSLSRLSHHPDGPTPLGIFRNVQRETYESVMSAQLVDAQAKRGPGDLAGLLASQGTWTVD